MRLVFSEREIEAQRRLKRAFDPDGRCNPETMFPEEGEEPGGAPASGPAAGRAPAS